jgi:hypothetical protein
MMGPIRNSDGRCLHANQTHTSFFIHLTLSYGLHRPCSFSYASRHSRCPPNHSVHRQILSSNSRPRPLPYRVVWPPNPLCVLPELPLRAALVVVGSGAGVDVHLKHGGKVPCPNSIYTPARIGTKYQPEHPRLELGSQHRT